MSDGERLRRALTELGTTWIKFGQMLSLAARCRRRRRRRGAGEAAGGGRTGSDRVWPSCWLNASSAVPCRISTARSTRIRWRQGRSRRFTGDTARRDCGGGEGPPRWRRASRARGSRAHGGDRRAISSTTIPGWRSCVPTMIVGEFSQMLHDAIDLSTRATEPSALRAELRRRTRHRHPDAVSRAVAPTSPHHESDLGHAVHRSCGGRGDRMGRRGTRAPRRRRLPRDDLPGFALSRRPPTGESPPSRRVTHRDPRLRRCRPHLFDAQTAARRLGDCRGNP